jgi:hypothetical protein
MFPVQDKRPRVHGRATVLAVLVAFLAGLFGLATAAGPAAAHSGGRAVVLVQHFTLDPAGDTWRANVVLTDNDSGSPIRGAKATVIVAGKEVVLEHGETPGQYVGTLKGAKPGPLSLELKVRAQPGAEPVLPADKKYDVQLVAGESLVIADGGGGGSNLPLIMGVAAAVLAVALLYGLYSVRRRTAVPVQK